MQFSDSQIREFQRIYKNEFNINISYHEAYSQFTDLMILGGIIFSPINDKEMETLEKLQKHATI